MTLTYSTYMDPVSTPPYGIHHFLPILHHTGFKTSNLIKADRKAWLFVAHNIFLAQSFWNKGEIHQGLNSAIWLALVQRKCCDRACWISSQRPTFSSSLSSDILQKQDIFLGYYNHGGIEGWGRGVEWLREVKSLLFKWKLIWSAGLVSTTNHAKFLSRI